jgi:hypothetical protein
MPQLQNWIKTGALLVFSFAALCCAVLGIHALAQEETTKAGIATLTMRFNLSDIQLPGPFVEPRTIPTSGHLQPFQSIASIFSTAVSAAPSKAQGAESAAATAVSGINITAIEEKLPRNCSLGTKQFCIGFENEMRCDNLPLNISNIVPEDIRKFVSAEVKSLRPLESILAKATPANIQGSLIVGLILIFSIILAFVGLFFELVSVRLLKLLKFGVCFVSVISFALFLITYIIIHYI